MFFNSWNSKNWRGETGVEAMKSDFEITDGDLKGANILLANYDGGAYDGWAFVLFEKDGKLYEVNGSHCSCMGIEDQWRPEETSIEAIEHRIDSYTFDGCRDELKGILANLKGAA